MRYCCVMCYSNLSTTHLPIPCNVCRDVGFREAIYRSNVFECTRLCDVRTVSLRRRCIVLFVKLISSRTSYIPQVTQDPFCSLIQLFLSFFFTISLLYFGEIYQHCILRRRCKVRLINFRDDDDDKQDAQLSQRDRAAGCVIVFAKSRTLELGDNHLRTL